MAAEGTTAVIVVDLDSLNAKQLAKEFKAAGKGVKSKDPVVKTEALGKLSNVRYYTEGGVFLPLVEQMVPKKVSQAIKKQNKYDLHHTYLPYSSTVSNVDDDE